MRGQRKLLGNYITVNKCGKGRSAKLIDARDRQLAYRFYYYVEVKRLRYEEVLKELETEFFIATDTIINRLQFAHKLVNSIYAEKPTINDMQAACPKFRFAALDSELINYHNKIDKHYEPIY